MWEIVKEPIEGEEWGTAFVHGHQAGFLLRDYRRAKAKIFGEFGDNMIHKLLMIQQGPVLSIWRKSVHSF